MKTSIKLILITLLLSSCAGHIRYTPSKRAQINRECPTYRNYKQRIKRDTYNRYANWRKPKESNLITIEF